MSSIHFLPKYVFVMIEISETNRLIAETFLIKETPLTGSTLYACFLSSIYYFKLLHFKLFYVRYTYLFSIICIMKYLDYYLVFVC